MLELAVKKQSTSRRRGPRWRQVKSPAEREEEDDAVEDRNYANFLTQIFKVTYICNKKGQLVVLQ